MAKKKDLLIPKTIWFRASDSLSWNQYSALLMSIGMATR